MTVRTRLGLFSALATAAFLLLAGPAAAESPWWHLETGSRPTYIDPNFGHPGQPEVQKIDVGLEGGQGALELGVGVTLEQSCSPPGLGCFAYPESFANENGLPVADQAELEAALETVYGAGEVSVIETLAGETLSFEVTHPSGKPLEAVGLGIGTVAVTQLDPGTPETTDGEIYITAENIGDANIAASLAPVKLSAVLPPGLEAVAITASEPFFGGGDFTKRQPIPCDPLPALTCTFAGSLVPYNALEFRVVVNATAPFDGGLVEAKVSGANAATASVRRPLVESGQPVPFGVEEYGMGLEEEGGSTSAHAGAHPFQFTTQIALNQGRDTGVFGTNVQGEALNARVNSAGLAKDVSFNLPPGLIGNPSKLTKCTTAQFFQTVNASYNQCPPSSAVGVAVSTVSEPFFGTIAIPEPIFNLEPEYGEPARFGFNVAPAHSPVLIDTSVRSGLGQDYGVTATVKNITQAAAFLSSTATFWGVPGAVSHQDQRGYGCFLKARKAEGPPCQPAEETRPPVLFSNPTQCSSPLPTSVDYDSWQGRIPLNFTGTFDPSGTLGGCNQVPFGPSINAEPTSDAATSPTGLNFEINVNDEGLNNAQGFVQSQIKKAVVTLPQGFTTNPSVAEGLLACPQGAYESEDVESTPGSGCPENSKIGDVEIESPLIEGHKVLGSLYVAKQGENPNANNLLTIYMVAKNAELGVMVRQALKVVPNPVTGQLTTEVDDIPQLPFSRFHLSFRQGQRSPLVTPPACGTYTVNADLYPYSEPAVPLHRESSFQITQGPEGQPCPAGVPPFHPGLEAGTINNAAGTYSPFVTHITRKDSEQEITRFSIKLPPGVIGKLAGVSSCSDAAIAQAKAREVEGGGGLEEANPSCPKNSEVGHSLVGSGVGNVLAYAPGKLYLAGPYHGSNISLVSITAAKVGPFDLGTVVVRFALRIDPETAEVFVDSQGSDPIPHIVDGIPVHLRDIRAYVDRKDFTLNPTSCQKKSTASTILGSGLNFASEADDQPVTVTSPFQAADCANLGFAPKLGLSLKGATKRGGTPAFKAVLTYPKGSYANIAKSVVTLPHSEFLEQSHIKTICTRVQFKEGKVPGEKCPKASIYGRAEAVTPLLSEPLKGPVYLRSSSHNLPDLVAALHNKQVDFALDGRIDSVKNGRIRNTFETVPDAPVSKFVLEMQGGKKGLLVNSTNLCKAKNHAISEFTGQNGKLHNTNPVVGAKCGGKGKRRS